MNRRLAALALVAAHVACASAPPVASPPMTSVPVGTCLPADADLVARVDLAALARAGLDGEVREAIAARATGPLGPALRASLAEAHVAVVALRWVGGAMAGDGALALDAKLARDAALAGGAPVAEDGARAAAYLAHGDLARSAPALAVDLADRGALFATLAEVDATLVAVDARACSALDPPAEGALSLTLRPRGPLPGAARALDRAAEGLARATIVASIEGDAIRVRGIALYDADARAAAAAAWLRALAAELAASTSISLDATVDGAQVRVRGELPVRVVERTR